MALNQDKTTETDAFECYGLAASLEPGVGLLLELAGDSAWLSWEETEKLRNWLAEETQKAPTGCPVSAGE